MKINFEMDPQEVMGMLGIIKDCAAESINYHDKCKIIDREREKMNEQRRDFECRVNELKHEHEETERRLRKELDEVNRRYGEFQARMMREHECGCGRHCGDNDDTTEEDL